jgi:hypothetical protein
LSSIVLDSFQSTWVARTGLLDVFDRSIGLTNLLSVLLHECRRLAAALS